jgi:hypothetical protein
MLNNKDSTPETDKWSGGSHVVSTDFARELERERNKLKEEVERLTAKYKDNED